MRTPTQRTLVLLAALSLALGGSAGCSHGQPQTAPTQAPDGAGDRSATGTGLRAALLTVADMPSGFSVADDPAGTAPSSGCPALDVDVDAAATDRAEILFTGGGLGPFVRERLLLLEPAAARRALADIRSAVTACRRFRAEDPTVGSVEFTVAELAIEPLGDETAAIRLTGRPSIVDIELRQDLVAVRSGEVVVLVSQVGVGGTDADLTTGTVRKAVRKVERRG